MFTAMQAAPYPHAKQTMNAAANQMSALRHAKSMYPNASHVFLISGAAIPAKRADDIKPVHDESITGAQWYAEYDIGYRDWYTGPEFVQLAATHIETLLQKWEDNKAFFERFHRAYYVHAHGHSGDTPESQVCERHTLSRITHLLITHCPADAGTQVIHTLLHHFMKVPVERAGECIQEEDTLFTEMTCGCDMRSESFKSFKGDDLRAQLQTSYNDEVTVAFRGVDNDVTEDEIMDMLRSFGVL